MDKSALVTQQIAAGGKLIHRLLADGFELSGAFWTRTPGDSSDYLYLITPELENRSAFAAHGKLGNALKALIDAGVPRDERVDPFRTKLIPPSAKMSQGVLRVYGQNHDDRPTWHFEDTLGSAMIEGGAYIYPAALFDPQPAAG